MIERSRPTFSVLSGACALVLGGALTHCHGAPRDGATDASPPIVTTQPTTASAIVATPPAPRRTPRSELQTTTASIALGNLDLTSFENVQKRRDVLRRYGTYPKPLLLLKAVPA